MCTVLLPPGDNPIAVNKYIISCNSLSQWPLACWDREFESRGGRWCLSLVSVVSCQVGSLWSADPSSRGVLPTVVRSLGWSRNLTNEEAMAHVGPQRQKKTKEKSNIRTDGIRRSTRRQHRLCFPPCSLPSSVTLIIVIQEHCHPKDDEDDDNIINTTPLINQFINH